MKLTFNTVLAALPPQGKKPDKSILAIQPLVDRFAEGLRILASSSSDTNPVTIDQVKAVLVEANSESSKKMSELPLAVKPIVISALVEQANEAGITDFTNDHAIEVLKFPKNIMPVVREVSQVPQPIPVEPKEPNKKKDKPAIERTFLNVENRLRDSILNAFTYVFREGIDSEYLDGVCKGPELIVGKNYAIIILSENGKQEIGQEPLRNHVKFYGKKDSNLRFNTLDDKPLRTLGRHIVFINVDVKKPSFRPEEETRKRRVDEGESGYRPDPEIVAVMNRGSYSRVFSGKVGE